MWCLYKCPIASLTLQLQSILNRRKRNAATVTANCENIVSSKLARSNETKKTRSPYCKEKKLKNKIHSPAQKGEVTQLLLPPAVGESKLSHTDTLRKASSRANVGFCKCLSHNSSRNASRFTICCSVTSSWHASPFSSASSFPQSFGPAIPTRMENVDCLDHVRELVPQLLPFRFLDALVDGLADCVKVLVHQRWL